MKRSFAGVLLAACLCGGPAWGWAQQASVSSAQAPSHDATWWKHAVIYEIYPRSFQDSNGDGIGDLNGIRERMGYLQGLGVDAIWIAPMYPSPQVDFGYDISDYENVDPQYGTMKDFDALLAAGKQHNVRIILDMVLNHTSDKHRWFVESASSRTNAKADWYVWNDGVKADAPGVTAYQKRWEHVGMVPPNNWTSVFGGSAWEWVPARKQFYYHRFYKQQPDLNWNNPAVEKAMFDTMRFWLDKGVAGFRLDAIPSLFEDPKLRNEPETGGVNAYGDPNVNTEYTDNLPEVHDVIRRMRAMVNAYPGNRVLIGETYLPNTAALQKWYGGASKNELQLPMDMLVGFGGRYSAAHFRKTIGEAETELNGSQPLFVFDNHDNPRSITRYGDGVHDVAIAKTVAAMLLTTRATALTYYGAEIGMPTTVPTRKEDVKDPIGITGWPKEKGRDGERTPMQWTPGLDAGFSTAKTTWLPIAPDYKTVNVQTESGEPGSLLNWYKELIELRRTNPALHDGGFVMLDAGDADVLAYVRTGSKPVVVAINMSAQAKTVSLDVGAAGVTGKTVKTIAASEDSLKAVGSLQNVTLPAYSAWVAEVR
ncbi:MAG TPA: alpha-glucosidase [Acidobacteriaceae bacterium]|nr:alpha-glucosidase [Acidobacteriaceae bacterium]